MHAAGIEKSVLLAWVWCLVRLVIFNTYEIVYLPFFILLLDQLITPSNEITPNKDDLRSSIAAQEDKNIREKRNISIVGKEQKHLNDMITKLMNEEREKAWHKIRKRL
ncbi:hypothetical protein NPIL_110931 [Nephila pilipes]|uniref:Uncharacterized protein n=1 Tax=Nephila pilipes TaxID=299642 RepID=A0A8X6URL3_NEPPI|nr:hypothetical protein NPIL_110931 [Nephila pilipes]